MSRALDAELLAQQAPARGDGGLGELQLAHVALAEEHAAVEAAVGPGQCSTKTRSPLSSTARRSARAGTRSAAASRSSRRPEPSSRPTRTSSAQASTRPEPHTPTGSSSPITPSTDAVVVDAHGLDRARRGAHAAADLGRLEGRAGGRGRRQQAVARAEGDLAVRADVDEQAQPAVALQAAGQQARDDVAADVGAERRQDAWPARAGARARRGRTASTSGSTRATGMNGATPSGSGSMPSASSTIVALPASATS